jgi:hypothetical protein
VQVTIPGHTGPINEWRSSDSASREQRNGRRGTVAPPRTTSPPAVRERSSLHGSLRSRNSTSAGR